MYDIITLTGMKVAELKSVAEELKISGADKLKKQDLIYKIMDVQSLQSAPASNEPTPPAPVSTEKAAPAEDNNSRKKRERIIKSDEPKPKADLFGGRRWLICSS
ncbi:MAG: Rho termination factor N-terminal domain-containing protein [Flavobacteriales bacterium]